MVRGARALVNAGPPPHRCACGGAVARGVAAASSPDDPPSATKSLLVPCYSGGDEARVARAGGSGRGASICATLANGTALPRAVPPRAAAGWPLPGAALSTTSERRVISESLQSSAATAPVHRSLSSSGSQWASRGQPQQPATARAPSAAQDAFQQQQQQQQQQHRQQQQWRQLEVPAALAPPVPRRPYPSPGDPMSHNAAPSPPSRPPSAASSTASSSPSGRAQHDHSRPLPPPRAPDSPAAALRGLLLDGQAAPPRHPGQAAPPAEAVSLQAPRPDAERLANEYVDTPFRPKPAARDAQCQLDAGHKHPPSNHQRSGHRQHHHHHHHHQHYHHHHHHHQQQQHKGPQAQRAQRHGPAAGDGPGPAHGAPVTKQPVSFTKEPGAAGTLGPGPRGDAPGLSIMCERCGRCRCESCREPPPLPSRWLCDNACFCSAETALDYASCLCCVKGLFYHCADNGLSGSSGSLDGSELGGNCADEPCSCGGPRLAARWSCLGALALFLPCLLCYWPLRGCVAAAEACYARHATQGCRCEPRAAQPAQLLGPPASRLAEALASDARDPEKRLLQPLGPEL